MTDVLSGNKETSTEEIIDALNRRISEYKKYLASTEKLCCKIFRHSRRTYLGKQAASSVEILTRELANIEAMSKASTPPATPCSVSIEVHSQMLFFYFAFHFTEKLCCKIFRHSRRTYLGKQAASSVEILTRELANIEAMSKASTPPATPCSVSIEVVSNGTTHLRPCVVLHTNYKDYLFNCPEGTSRFLAANRLKANNLGDIFFTRDTWDHFAGVAGLLKAPVASSSKESGRTIRLHGSHNKSNYFERQNEQVDADLPSTITLKIDIAFLIELKPPPRSLDIRKIQNLKIPGGPHMKQLKSGEDITLPDGRFIKAEDVLSAPKTEPQPACLIVECNDLRKLPSLQNNTLIRGYIGGDKTNLRYVVHFTEPPVMNSEEYQAWMASFGQESEHIIVNGTGPCLPHMEAVYRMNVILNCICPTAFPLLYPLDFNGTIQQAIISFLFQNGENSALDDDCEKDGNKLYARPFQRFFLRKPSVLEATPPNVSLVRTDLMLQLKENEVTA
ncbi:unnamed protein product, partial [Gongylonema pulchrum]|uniref:ribonuclease Z n=1 Tax=Gongylonema pulchrum TaxID=637853 RepID=A0A183E5A8_9BILA